MTPEQRADLRKLADAAAKDEAWDDALCAACTPEVIRALCDAVDAAELDATEQHAALSRVWSAVHVTTYHDANSEDIGGFVADIVAERDALRAEVARRDALNAGHPAMCCGQCQSEITASRASCESLIDDLGELLVFNAKLRKACEAALAEFTLLRLGTIDSVSPIIEPELRAALAARDGK